MQDLSRFVFITMANITLLKRDSYLHLIKYGVKVDTVTPVHIISLFPDDVITKVEEQAAL